MNLIKTFPIRSIVNAAVALALFCVVEGCNRSAEVESKNVQTFTKENFKTEVLSSSQPVLVDFWATWCGPCKMVAPTVAEIADEFAGKAKVGKVDVDAQPELASEYEITGIPALLIFKDGKKVDQLIGVQSKEELKSRVGKYVSEAAPNHAPKS